MPDPLRPRRYRFGVFEADAATGELRKQGLRIKLNVQPFQVLLMLLEHPGELLTREQISRELWPEGTFVDYDHGVNSAVNRIRDALGDTARNPRFIETLARRGYRFLAPVHRISEPEIPEPITPLTGNPPDAQPLTPEPEPRTLSRFLPSRADLPNTPHRTVQTLFVLLQAMYLGFYIGALANLPEIEDLASPLPRAWHTLAVVILTATLLIPARAFAACAALLYPPAARAKLLKLWPFLLPFDILWSLAPFLLLHHINFGLALACTAFLVYSPFAQRSLILMGAGQPSVHTPNV